jgi:hypothetical protein
MMVKTTRKDWYESYIDPKVLKALIIRSDTRGLVHFGSFFRLVVLPQLFYI